MDAAREGARVRHEREVRGDAGGRRRAGGDLRDVAVRQRVVGVQVAVAGRVVGAVDGLAARPGAARHAAHEEGRRHEVEREQRHRGEQRRGGEAARMRDMRRGHGGEVLGNRTGELRDARRRAVRMLVDRGVGLGRRVAVVRGDVDHARPGAGRRRGGEQLVDERGADAVRRGREQGAGRQRRHELRDVGLGPEPQLTEHGREVRERLRDRLAGLRVGEDARDLELRMAEHEAQQLAGHVAGAAEDDRRDARRHGAFRVSARPGTCRRGPRPR